MNDLLILSNPFHDGPEDEDAFDDIEFPDCDEDYDYEPDVDEAQEWYDFDPDC